MLLVFGLQRWPSLDARCIFRTLRCNLPQSLISSRLLIVTPPVLATVHVLAVLEVFESIGARLGIEVSENEHMHHVDWPAACHGFCKFLVGVCPQGWTDDTMGMCRCTCCCLLLPQEKLHGERWARPWRAARSAHTRINCPNIQRLQFLVRGIVQLLRRRLHR